MSHTLPENMQRYLTTKSFTETTVPKQLLANHSIKAGSWGQVVVESGEVDLVFATHTHHVTPDSPGAIPPVESHHLELRGPVQFYVTFYRPK